MNRCTVLGLLLASGCQPPTDDGHDAIEVTGYLDGARVSLAALDGDVTAMGRDGAASPGSEVTLEDATTGDRATTTAGDLGAFAVSVPAAIGDQLVVEVAGAAADDRLVRDLAATDPFPPAIHELAYLDPLDPQRAVIEVRFDPGREDGQVWAADLEAGAVAVLAPFDAGTLHGGDLDGASVHDSVVLTWVVGSVVSQGAAVTVTATPP